MGIESRFCFFFNRERKKKRKKKKKKNDLIFILFPTDTNHTCGPSTPDSPGPTHDAVEQGSPDAVDPPATDHDATDDVDDADGERQDWCSRVCDGEADGLDVELEEDAGDTRVRDNFGLLCDGVLVGGERPQGHGTVVVRGHE